MSKSELDKLNVELGRVLDEINHLAAKYPSIMIADDDNWSESFSAVAELYNDRIENYRKKLRKIANKLPKVRKKRVCKGT